MVISTTRAQLRNRGWSCHSYSKSMNKESLRCLENSFLLDYPSPIFWKSRRNLSGPLPASSHVSHYRTGKSGRLVLGNLKRALTCVKKGCVPRNERWRSPAGLTFTPAHSKSLHASFRQQLTKTSQHEKSVPASSKTQRL